MKSLLTILLRDSLSLRSLVIFSVCFSISIDHLSIVRSYTSVAALILRTAALHLQYTVDCTVHIHLSSMCGAAVLHISLVYSTAAQYISIQYIVHCTV